MVWDTYISNAKSISKDKMGYLKMIKNLIQKEDIIILNLHANNNRQLTTQTQSA